MAGPVWLSLGRAAQRSVGYACAALGRESQPRRTLEPSRDEPWCETRARSCRRLWAAGPPRETSAQRQSLRSRPRNQA